MSEAVDEFFGAWGETDPEARLAAIRNSLADSGTYADPMTAEPLVGPNAAADYVAAFARNAPGATATVVDSQQRHGTTRSTVEFRMATGQVQHGQYFIEFAPDHKIARMIGFVGLGTPS